MRSRNRDELILLESKNASTIGVNLSKIHLHCTYVAIGNLKVTPEVHPKYYQRDIIIVNLATLNILCKWYPNCSQLHNLKDRCF